MAEHLGSALVACLVSYVFVGLAGEKKRTLWQRLSVFSLEVAYKTGGFFQKPPPS